MIEFDVGDVIDNRYEVVEEIGKGGMGIVLRAVDRDSGEHVALKYCPNPDPQPQRRFGREVRIMAGINHPNVMPVLAFNEDHDPPYFTMPIARGSIGDEVDAAMPIGDAINIFKSICLGVQAVHGAGSTHRDLKPDNAMRMADGAVVISDLGLARLTDRDTTTLTQTAAFLGTRMYCAPEQLALGGSRAADERTDIYQLGKVLYELTTGDTPALIDPDLINPGLMHVIDRATQQLPDRRYQTVGQLMDAVESFLRTLDPDVSISGEFDAALEQAKTLIKDQKYSTKNLERLLELLVQMPEDSAKYLEQFERIPKGILRVMSRRTPQQLERPLERYCAAVEDVIGGYNFSHAETVAGKMSAIFDSAEVPVLKVLSLKATMIAAVRLHRFAAMEVYDQMLQAITEPAVAGPVADMLRDNIYYYRNMSGRVPEEKLHPAIRGIPIDR
ncbi:MAG TPA: serine/threonine-protein kinase [Gallionella sp.]|nr:serine/threonine-protein kinase [Gallionella sp.]